MTRNKLIAAGFVVLLLAIGANLWLTLNTRATLTSVVQQSAATRVTTVAQRCGLTIDVEDLSHLSAGVITAFAPRIAAPFDRLDKALLKSYRGCEKQFATVKKISQQAGRP